MLNVLWKVFMMVILSKSAGLEAAVVTLPKGVNKRLFLRLYL